MRAQERGSVTAEFAVILPAVVVAILATVGMVLAGVMYIECHEAARAGVREGMLRGDAASAVAVAQVVAGSRANVTASIDDAWVNVWVTKPVLISGFPLEVSSHMSAPMEQP